MVLRTKLHMQSLPIELKRSGEGLVYWTSLEVSRHFQGAGTSVPSTVPCNAEKKEECHLFVDFVPREGGNLERLHASL